MSERKGLDITRLAQMSGKTVCTITGYSYIPALQEIPGATLRTYPTSANMYEDISIGRCDVGFSDALINIDTAVHTAHFHLTYKYLAPPTAAEVAAHPFYSRFEKAELCFYIPAQEKTFERALTAGIRAFYASGLEARLLRKWGADPASWLRPPPLVAKERIGVDRPKGWTAPSWKP
jgi:ABC-type amino acid transport substrate-binding protein